MQMYANHVDLAKSFPCPLLLNPFSSKVLFPTSIYLQKTGVDAAENEPLKVWGSLTYEIRNLNIFRCYVDPCNCNAADISQTDYFSTTANGMPLYYSYQSCGPVADYTVGRQRASVGKISAKCCSFSAVSAPIFAIKYAFCSILQNLPDSQAEICQNF